MSLWHTTIQGYGRVVPSQTCFNQPQTFQSSPMPGYYLKNVVVFMLKSYSFLYLNLLPQTNERTHSNKSTNKQNTCLPMMHKYVDFSMLYTFLKNIKHLIYSIKQKKTRSKRSGKCAKNQTNQNYQGISMLHIMQIYLYRLASSATTQRSWCIKLHLCPKFYIL